MTMQARQMAMGVRSGNGKTQTRVEDEHRLVHKSALAGDRAAYAKIVNRYADRVVAFYQGRILADGEPADVLMDQEVRRYVTGGVR